MITWILIILGSNNGAINAIEVSSEKACIAAKQKIEEYKGGSGFRYSGICTPKFIKEEK